MNEPSPRSCIFCDSTDQVVACEFPGAEKSLRAKFPAPFKNLIEELMSPFGVCAKCRTLSEDEISARAAVDLRNASVELLIESGVPPEVAGQYVSGFPSDPDELFEVLRHLPLLLPRKEDFEP
jgi:hypothetical protein